MAKHSFNINYTFQTLDHNCLLFVFPNSLEISPLLQSDNQEMLVFQSLVLRYALFCLQGRNGLGSIYVFSSGNGGQDDDSCAADGYASNRYTISVGSADQAGRQAFYDEDCSGKMAVTYSYNSAVTSDQVVSP